MTHPNTPDFGEGTELEEAVREFAVGGGSRVLWEHLDGLEVGVPEGVLDDPENQLDEVTLRELGANYDLWRMFGVIAGGEDRTGMMEGDAPDIHDDSKEPEFLDELDSLIKAATQQGLEAFSEIDETLENDPDVILDTDGQPYLPERQLLRGLLREVMETDTSDSPVEGVEFHEEVVIDLRD